MGADWASTIVVNIFLAASPPSRAGFSTVMFLVDQDSGNSLNGARVMSFASSSEAQTAQTAGYISATTLAFPQAGFSQQPTPSKIKVGYRDVSLAETVAAALTAIQAVDNDWYAIAQYSRVDADIVAMATAIEAGAEKLYIAQSADASWLDAGLPAGLSTLAAKERTALIYHDAAAQPADLAWAVSRTVFDADVKSAPWSGQIRGVNALTANLSAAQRDFIVTNKANVGLPYSSAPVYVDSGQNCNGRGIYEILSGDWLKARVKEDIAYLKLSHTARGEKIIVDATGQAKILAILNQRLRQGEDAGHFVRGQTRATGESITAADILARKLRFKVEAQIAADARLFEFNVYLQPDALQLAA